MEAYRAWTVWCTCRPAETCRNFTQSPRSVATRVPASSCSNGVELHRSRHREAMEGADEFCGHSLCTMFHKLSCGSDL